VPSEYPGYFPAVHSVDKGDRFESGQQREMARAINARILSGLGDVHWRCIFAFYSFVRNFRNPDSGFTNYPAEDEWLTYYGLLPETETNWPAADPGFPEGLNVNSPVNTYFFGIDPGLVSEDSRLNDVPLREPPLIGALPVTDLDYWTLGKTQRGVVLPSDLDDFTDAPAMFAARSVDSWNSLIGYKTLFHKTAGGRIDGPTEAMNREKGQQINQMRSRFCSEYRGTADQRADDSSWQPVDLTVDYESIFGSQWFLAPAYGVEVGSLGVIEAQYPIFEWDDLAAAGTYGDDGGSVAHSPRSDFTFAGAIVVGENLGASERRVQLEEDGVVIATLSVNQDAESNMVWWPVSKTGAIKAKLLDTLTAGEDIYVELAELLIHKPEPFDVDLFIRMSTARSNSPTIYRGKIVDTAKEISDAYFVNGCVYNPTNATVPVETKIGKYPHYQSMRDFILKWIRVVTYKNLKGYHVNGDGNSVLIFERRGNGDSDADIFFDIAPSEAAITSARPDVHYKVESAGTPSGYVTYDGNNYSLGQKFKGNESRVIGFSNATDLVVKEDFFIVTPEDIADQGESNEWILSIGGQMVFKDTTGSDWKPSNAGDVYGTMLDRCTLLSESMKGDTGSSAGKELNRYGRGNAAASDTVIRTEIAPGQRYEGDNVPYYGSSRHVYTPINTADGASSGDCRDSIFGDGDVDIVGEGDCNGISAHYRSCQVYKAPYLIKEVRVGASTNLIEIELQGRLRKTSSAPTAVLDTSSSRASYLTTDTGERSDENTVVGALNWYVDGQTPDQDRIGDVAPNASTDYDATAFYGSLVCRFFLQRLMPEVYNDSDALIQPERDRRSFHDLPAYAEFIIRASVSGFLDEDKVESTMVYHPKTALYHSYCDGQSSRDLTMERLMEIVNANGVGQDRLPIRDNLETKGYGVFPQTKCYAGTWREMGQAINLLKSARFGVPVYLESKRLTYWDTYPVTIETINGWKIARGASYIKPTTLRTSDTAYYQDNIPFADNAEAYMTIFNDGSGDKMLCYWSEVHWRMRPHPKVLEAVPETLRSYVDSLGLGVPYVYKPATLVRSVLLRDPEPGDVLTDFTELDIVSDPAEGCAIGQSGVLAPKSPPTGDLVTSSVGSGLPGGSAGDAESSSRASMGVESIGETYIRVDVK